MFLISSLIFFALGELLLRAYLKHTLVYDVEMTRYANKLKVISDNPKIGHVHKPNQRLSLMGVVVATNSDGLREGSTRSAGGTPTGSSSWAIR